MANTTNFNWETPDDTDLVKDGAAAIRTLGNSIDTSFVDLKGGTTGQILSKATNADLDFTWVTSAGDIEGVTAGTGISGGGTSGTVTITNSMATAIDAKGDLVVGTGADTFSRLAVGTNDYVLTAASGEATGMKWAAISAGGMTLLSTTTVSGTSTTISSISQDYTQLMIQLIDVKFTSNSSELYLSFNAGTSAFEQNTRLGNPDTTAWLVSSNDRIKFMGGTGTGTGNNNFCVWVHNYTSTTSYKPFIFFGNGYDNNAGNYEGNMGGGAYTNTIAIQSLKIDQGHSYTMSGTVKIWGIK